MFVGNRTPGHKSPRRKEGHEQGQSADEPGYCFAARKKRFEVAASPGKEHPDAQHKGREDKNDGGIDIGVQHVLVLVNVVSFLGVS